MKSNSQDINVKDVLARMKSVYHVHRDAELARALTISPQTLSSWRQRDAIPYSLCVECARSKNVSLDWLLYGDSNQIKAPEGAHEHAAKPSAHQSEVEEGLRRELNRILLSLPEEDIADILNEAKYRQKLRVLERKFETLQSEFFTTQGVS
jgi:CI repressor-like protein